MINYCTTISMRDVCCENLQISCPRIPLLAREGFLTPISPDILTQLLSDAHQTPVRVMTRFRDGAFSFDFRIRISSSEES